MPRGGGGLLLLLTGDGARRALGGMLLRALGQGMNVLVCVPDGDQAVYRRLAAVGGLPGRLTVGPLPGRETDPYDVVMVPEAGSLLAAGGGRELDGLLRAGGRYVVLTGGRELLEWTEEADLVTRFERRR